MTKRPKLSLVPPQQRAKKGPTGFTAASPPPPPPEPRRSGRPAQPLPSRKAAGADRPEQPARPAVTGSGPTRTISSPNPRSVLQNQQHKTPAPSPAQVARENRSPADPNQSSRINSRTIAATLLIVGATALSIFLLKRRLF